MCLITIRNIQNIFIILSILIKLSFTKTVPLANNRINAIANSQNLQKSGLQQLKILRNLIKECENPSTNATTSSTHSWQCLKTISLHLLDDITSRDIVPVWNGVRFVRVLETTVNDTIKRSPIYDSDFWKRKDVQYLTWFDRLVLSFTRLMQTHTLEINLKELMNAYLSSTRDEGGTSNFDATDAIGTARHRRHRHNMMMTMMFGVTALGAVLVPVGFQLLSVVSGKALLLAKMALLLASINGLKRVANSGLHYGLYHVPGEHYGGLYDRGDVHHPRNVQNLAPHIPQTEVGLTFN